MRSTEQKGRTVGSLPTLLTKRGLSLAPSVLALVFASFIANAALADTETQNRKDSDRQWVPSFSIYTAGLPEKRRASANSSEENVSGFQDGESVGFPWSIGGEIGLASPVLGSSKWKPRIIVHGGAGYVLDGNDPVSTQGDPGNVPSLNPSQPDPTSFENQGSAVRAQAKPWILTGGVGALFEFEAFDQTIYLRPSLEWMYRKDTIDAILGKAEGEVLGENDACEPCRVLFINAQTEKGYHSLGVGLEAAIDSGRLGDFTTRFFISGRVYGILGDREAAISPVGTWNRTDGQPTTRDPATTTFNIRYERKPVHYRFGVGFQVVWQPE